MKQRDSKTLSEKHALKPYIHFNYFVLDTYIN